MTGREEVLNIATYKGTDGINASLMAEFTPHKVKAALDSIVDMKAPGPDGVPSIFFKRIWEMVGNKVQHEVLNVLNGGVMPEGWNDTTIVLIPKVK